MNGLENLRVGTRVHVDGVAYHVAGLDDTISGATVALRRVQQRRAADAVPTTVLRGLLDKYADLGRASVVAASPPPA